MKTNSRILKYYINLDERGEFSADVRRGDKTVFEIKGFEIFEDGFMKHKKDLNNLFGHLFNLGIADLGDVLEFGN